MGILHVVIRATLDWERAGYEQLDSPFMQETARLWDSTFRLGYMACRARIRNIAERTHRARPDVRWGSRVASDQEVHTSLVAAYAVSARLAAGTGAGGARCHDVPPPLVRNICT